MSLNQLQSSLRSTLMDASRLASHIGRRITQFIIQSETNQVIYMADGKWEKLVFCLFYILYMSYIYICV